MMKKRMILFIVIMLLIVGGCNNQTSQPTGEANKNEQVKKENINNPQNKNSSTENDDPSSNKEDDTSQSTNEYEKQVWLRYAKTDFYSDEMINITNFSNGKIDSISYRNFIESKIRDDDLSEVISKENYIGKITPSSKYLILKLPQYYTKYIKYDIVSSAKKKFPNIEKYLNRSYRSGTTGTVYSVIYNIKDRKIVSLDEVKNGKDKEFIYDWILEYNSFYISSLDTIKYVDKLKDFGYIDSKYRNYKESKIVLVSYKENKLYVIFYDLMKGEVVDHIEIADDSLYGDIYISQWNDDGTVYFSLVNTKNYASFQYNLLTKRLTILDKDIFYPVRTEDKKYMIFYKEYDGIYAENLNSGEEILIKKFDDYCAGLRMLTIMNY